jgi:hypothetical protein
MDVGGYLDSEEMEVILERNNFSETHLRDQRYDAVIHLVTAAVGAEVYYTVMNNQARRETAEEAAALDKRLSEAWLGHNHLHIVDNRSGFSTKMTHTMEIIMEHVGALSPVGQHLQRKVSRNK